GGLYAYTRHAFGDIPGFLVAWGYWVSTVTTLPALAIAFVGSLDPFVPGLVRAPPSAAALAVGTIWLMVAINCAGVRAAGQVQVVTVALKILPLVVVGIGGLLDFQPASFTLPPRDEISTTGQIMATMTLTLWAFLGLESGTIPAESVRSPARTI